MSGQFCSSLSKTRVSVYEKGLKGTSRGYAWGPAGSRCAFQGDARGGGLGVTFWSLPGVSGVWLKAATPCPAAHAAHGELY